MVAQILSPAQRAALFDPPSDPAAIERLYTLGPDDLVEVFRRRRPANRIGYAVQFGYLRHPGRAIERGLGLRAFQRADCGMVFATASEMATTTDRCDAIIAAMVERLRGAGVVLSVPTVLGRIALVARAEARRQAFASDMDM